ncbi:hypothetical protein HK097_002301 [Rhizophlyctis rosea]|uniref:Uncharacterized protein n=1 Tax=Rhizophlyctis rosea TaxID=64517 RepID=A0AAD5S3G6_9FUNG|nr:hypothetical protein HK097_002301 [Rhizophlyctis rosea]
MAYENRFDAPPDISNATKDFEHFDKRVEKPDKEDVVAAEAEVLGLTPSQTTQFSTNNQSQPSHTYPHIHPPPAPAPVATPNRSNNMGPYADVQSSSEKSDEQETRPWKKKERVGGIEPLPIYDPPGSPHPAGLALLTDDEMEGWPAGRSKM